MEALILQQGENRNLEFLLLPPRKLSGSTSPILAGTAPQHRTNTTPPPPDCNPQHTASTSSLAATAGRRRRRYLLQSQKSSSARSFYCRGAHSTTSHRSWLHPLEHDDETEHYQPTPDPAPKIRRDPPGIKLKQGITPKTGITPKHTRSTPNKYYPNSGASPSPSLAGYSGGEDVRSARSPSADSQGGGGGKEATRGEEMSHYWIIDLQ